MPSIITHAPNVIRTYLRRGEDGLAEIQTELEHEVSDRPGGKFGKREALYLPQAPVPPTLWRTSCGRCRFWEKGEPGEPGRCHIVGREGDRFGGEAIHYRGWCGFWMPPAGEPPFAWIHQRLDPDGKTSVRGVYDPETTAKERQREQGTQVPTEPDAQVTTEPDARRAAIDGVESGDDGG